MPYDHKSVEARWQKYWQENRSFRAERRTGRPKIYALDMFPYPSGSGLHVGHPEGYTATDIICRHKRMKGYDVLHPMGWDAFGLPAEQYAIQTGTHPAVTTNANVDMFRAQLQRLGFAYDWEREINTTDPEYFRWTQWIFLKLFERGLAIQGEIPVNWCPALGTVLANEEVIDGRSERGNHPVVRQPLRQWQLKITAYADRLAQELEGLDWPETMQKQRDWIGRSEGAEVDFKVADRDVTLRVFTTRPDTLFGATYVVVAPDHKAIAKLVTEPQRTAVEAYAAAAARKSDLERTALSKDKTGVFTGSYAINPLTQKPVPIYTADYVLGAYGTGAIMAVPAHDERDFAFAKTFGLPIIEVVSPDGSLHEALEVAFTGDGIAVRSGAFDGQPTATAKENVTKFLEEQGIGEKKVNYRLRDWLFSRQRYWGEPIPIYFPVKTSGDPRKGDPCEIDFTTPIAVDDSELPLKLPELDDYKPGDPQGPLVRALDWRFFQKDGKWFARETNTMPQWAGSCWYYLRYLDPKNNSEIFSEKAYDDWMPVDLYVGGNEHAVLHLLYARFWHKVLHDIGVVRHAEPFTKLVHQGLILGMVYRFYAQVDGDDRILASFDGDSPTDKSPDTGEIRLKDSGTVVVARYVIEKDVIVRDSTPTHRETGVRLVPVAEKMSKSRGNVVNPDTVVEEFGADSLRLYEMFMGPLEAPKPWQTSGIQGVRRFLDRVDAICNRPISEDPADKTTRRLVARSIKKVGEDIDAMRFNTAISTMMIWANHLATYDEPAREAVEALLLCLCPFAPHLTEELWERLGHAPSLCQEPWPSFDPALCVDDTIEMGVQVNGKVRGRITLRLDATEEQARSTALDEPNVRKFIGDKTVKKTIYVPSKILNLIIG